ncbi:MAG: PAS domain S-box protein [Planctomycetes bacterium]|nr:PAS domain S-box protein [Planctomycetota bacterium]
MHHTSNTGRGQVRRVLIVDDNPAIHEDYRRVLSSNDSSAKALNSAKALLLGDEPSNQKPDLKVELVSAHQGEEALDLVRQSVADGTHFKVAFVDVRMPPGIDGIETISRMWKIDPNIQVVICTAFSDYNWEETCEKLEQSDRFLILKKPFDVAVIRQMASSLLEKHELRQQVQQQIADLSRESTYARAIIDSSYDAYLEANSEGQIVDWGSKAEALFGWTADDIHCEDLGVVLKLDANSNETLDEWLSELAAQSTGQCREMIGVRRDGREFPVELSISPIELDGFRFFNAFVHDITARRELQLQLGHAQKMESIGLLAAGIAHEINTPAQYVGDNFHFVQDAFCDISNVFAKYDELLQAAKDGSVTEADISVTEKAINDADMSYLLTEVPNAIEQSLEGIGRISAIVQGMKVYSHPGQKEQMDTDIHRAIENAIAISSTEWKHFAEVETNFDPTMPLINCHASDVNQVFLNLIVNAAHAISDVTGDGVGAQGKITIATRVVDDLAELRFSDTGTGIAEENRMSIYDAFFTTKDVGKGTGQGLAIAHSIIVDGYGGTIDFETAVGKGTTFIIRLPIHSARSNPPAELAVSTIG